MVYAHDTELTLVSTTELVNTQFEDDDRLATLAGLDGFLAEYGYTTRTDDEAELRIVRALRPRLLEFWTLAAADKRDEAVELVNALLAETDARPYLARHEGYWEWHLHVRTGPPEVLSAQVLAEAAMAISELIRDDDLDRLRFCAADDCRSVLVDLSRNRSKRFCDTGNCANRTHVQAYRARKAGSA